MNKEQFFGMYIGQKVHIESLKPVISRTLLEVATNHIHCSVGNCISTRIDTTKADCKLILRPFESMTDEEVREIPICKRNNSFLEMYLNDYKDIDHTIYYTHWDFKDIEYLISIGIDVFNLKERGWAIYETDLKKGTNNETENL